MKIPDKSIFIFAKSGLIPRSSDAAESGQRMGVFGIKPDVLKNFLTERASVRVQLNAKDTAEFCSAEAHLSNIFITIN